MGNIYSILNINIFILFIRSTFMERTVFDLREVKRELAEEKIFELIGMLEGCNLEYKLRNSEEKGGYVLSFFHNLKEDTKFSCALMISARDSGGNKFSLYRHPTSTDSFYDSCIDVVKGLRAKISKQI